MLLFAVETERVWLGLHDDVINRREKQTATTTPAAVAAAAEAAAAAIEREQNYIVILNSISWFVSNNKLNAQMKII